MDLFPDDVFSSSPGDLERNSVQLETQNDNRPRRDPKPVFISKRVRRFERPTFTLATCFQPVRNRGDSCSVVVLEEHLRHLACRTFETKRRS